MTTVTISKKSTITSLKRKSNTRTSDSHFLRTQAAREATESRCRAVVVVVINRKAVVGNEVANAGRRNISISIGSRRTTTLMYGRSSDPMSI